MNHPDPKPFRPRWRSRLHEVIFEADTPAGKTFDVVLIASILASVTAVMLESAADRVALSRNFSM